MVDVQSIEGVASQVTNVGAGINYAQIVFYTTIVVAAVLILFIVFIIIHVLRYNMLTFIEERHEHGVFVKTKRAKIVYDKSVSDKNPVEMIRILGDRIHRPIMPPTHVIAKMTEAGKMAELGTWYKSLYGTTTRGKKALRLLKDGDTLTAIPFTNREVSEYLRVTKPVRSQWANNLFLEGMDMYRDEPNFMQKYGVMMGLAGLMITMIIVFALLFNQFDQLEGSSAAINGFAQALNEHASALKQSCSQALT